MGAPTTSRVDRAAIGRRAIDALVPLVKALGTHRPGDLRMPEHYVWSVAGFEVLYAPAVAADPLLRRLQSILDISADPGRKVFSVHWDPMVIVAFKKGPWIDMVMDLSSTRDLH